MKKVILLTFMFLFVNVSAMYRISNELEAELSEGFKEWVDLCDQFPTHSNNQHKTKITSNIKNKIQESFEGQDIQPSANLAGIIAEYSTLSDEVINEANQKFKEAYHLGVVLNGLDNIKEALALGANINFPIDEEGNSMLRRAISYGEADLVRFLLEVGADINAKNYYDESVDKNCNNPVVAEILRKFRNGESLEKNTPKEVVGKPIKQKKSAEVRISNKFRPFRRHRPCFIL